MIEYEDYPWSPMDWEVREWNTQLLENELSLEELHLKKKKEALMNQEKKEEDERRQRLKELDEEEKEIQKRQEEIERKEAELKKKSELLETAIRVNEINIANRLGEMEKRFQDLEQEVFRWRQSSNLDIGERSSERINLSSGEGDDERSTQSEESN